MGFSFKLNAFKKKTIYPVEPEKEELFTIEAIKQVKEDLLKPVVKRMHFQKYKINIDKKCVINFAFTEFIANLEFEFIKVLV